MPRTSSDDRAVRAVRWLHLSDLHFRVGETWDVRATLSALIRKLEDMRSRDRVPDLIFVTGDIAWSGKRDEYEQAERFFARVMDVTGVPRESWFVVPGNHDVDQSKVTRFQGSILNSLQSEGDVEALFGDMHTLQMLAPRMNEFYAFTVRFLGPARGWSSEKPWRVDSPEVSGVPVGVLQLNSTWAGGTRDDKTNGLLVGEAQLREALLAVEDTHLRIALMHHSLGDLREFDREAIDGILGRDNQMHFFLRGHLHKTKSIQRLTPDGGYFEIAAGAFYTPDKHPRAFNFVELDLSTGRGQLHLFRFSEESGGFWAADTQTYEKIPNGIAALRLPKKLKLDQPPKSDLSEAKQRNTATRYRSASAAYHGQARFIGFAQTRERPNAQIEELFVPLSFSVRGAEKDQEAWTTVDIVRHLVEPRDDGGASRIVVLGDPGSGKTTLTRFITGVVAGTVPIDGIAIKGEPLPIRVAFRDYVQQTRGTADLSLVEYIEQQARAELSVPLPTRFLERTLLRGEAVVLFDGLDEVGTAADRVTMRDRLAAFCKTYSRVPMLLTSRSAGYDDAPLGPAAPADEEPPFAHVALTAFTDVQMEEFVRRWYGLQERTDPIARDRGIADLLSALEAAPRVKELARSPLLATLIAMIHRFEANLPGERAKLYELCIRTMLETWPAARGRRFTEIDEGLQRAYLEELAWTMQIERTDYSKKVVVDRTTLARRLENILRARDYKDQAPEVVSRLVERWIEYLSQGTGLLVEQSAGAFGFFHLSFLEYLAARALERHLDQQTLGEAIAKQLKNPMWMEVCLLAIGWHANDAVVLDDLFLHVNLSEPIGTLFLLNCLREEARFTAEQRHAIMGAAGMFTLSGHRFADVVTEIIQNSARNGKPVDEWLAQQLATSRGSKLRSTYALQAGRTSVAEVLNSRPDAADCVRDLLPFLNAPIRSWLDDHVTPADVIEFFDHEASYDTIAMRAAISLEAGEALISSLLTLQLANRAMLAAAVPNSTALSATLNRTEFPLRHALPSPREVSVHLLEPLGRRSDKMTIDIDQAAIPGPFTRALPLRRFLSADNSGIDYADFPSFERSLNSVWYFLTKTLRPQLRKSPDSVSLSPQSSREEVPAPTTRRLRSLAKSTNEIQRTLIAADAYVGFSIARSTLAHDIRFGYANTRMQHRFVLVEWPWFEELMPAKPSPHALALYCVLGWTAATTTWEWPGTSRWIRTMKEVPQHWLPRSQVHLCWLTHDPTHVPHREGLEAALKEGDSDPEFPGFAARMRELLGLAADRPRRAK